MTPHCLRFTILVTIVAIFTIILVPEPVQSISRRGVRKVNPHTPAKRAETGHTTTPKPGHVTTHTPGNGTMPGSSTTPNPGNGTTPKPGIPTTPEAPGTGTTPKPGGITTLKPGNGTKPINPPVAEAPEIPGLKFIGWAGHEAMYIGETTMKQEEAWAKCFSIQDVTNTIGRLFSIVGDSNFVNTVYGILSDKAPDESSFWIADVVIMKEGKEMLHTYPKSGGVRTEDVTGRGMFMSKDQIVSKRSVTGSNSSYSSYFGLHQSARPRSKVGKVTQMVSMRRGKRQGEEGGGGEATVHLSLDSDTSSGSSGGLAVLAARSDTNDLRNAEGEGAGHHHMTVTESHYPWIPEWNAEKGGCQIQTCKPRKCTTKTPSCTITNEPCTVSEPTCNLLDTVSCTVICENCNITQPDCWVGSNECELITQRHCTAEPPECVLTTPPCRVSRPPCVTQYPDCFVEQKNETCNVKTTCKTEQGKLGINCTVQPRDCTKDEIKAGITECTYQECGPHLICIEPALCRKDVVVCPAPKTFCPPETVQCPPPYVNCSSPTIICTEPKFNCPYPEINCEEPQVSCTSPRISCPPTVTKCGHPAFTCPPPKVECPPAEVECEAPTVCEVIKPPENCGMTTKPPEPECGKDKGLDTDCSCFALKRLVSPEDGKSYKRVGALCDQLLKPLCATTL